MKWISVKERMPYDRILCVVRFYNDTIELMRFDGKDWWEISNRMSVSDAKISDEMWPTHWYPTLDVKDIPDD